MRRLTANAGSTWPRRRVWVQEEDREGWVAQLGIATSANGRTRPHVDTQNVSRFLIMRGHYCLAALNSSSACSLPLITQCQARPT